MSAILLDGSIVHYEALGRGRPIVFLHGWIGSWRYWISAMQVASTSFRAYGLDLFGFGDTAHNTQRYSLEQQAGLVNQFLEDMGIGKVAIVGHGLGALVGFAFISQWPRSVDRMMAVNCPLEYSSVNSKLTSSSMPDLVDWLSNRTPEAAAALSEASKGDPVAVSASMAGLQANNLFEKVSSQNVPCLLVYGANDPVITAPAQDKVDSLPAYVHQLGLDGTGHFPMIDNPSKFNRLLTDFLALDTGASPKEMQLKEEWKRRVR
ncbi:MAG: alpha/beta hydrolase [Anaerolineales bacterium]|nr:alpha/beta hydrolase [Anaerolineales bacterium]